MYFLLLLFIICSGYELFVFVFGIRRKKTDVTDRTCKRRRTARCIPVCRGCSPESVGAYGRLCFAALSRSVRWHSAHATQKPFSRFFSSYALEPYNDCRFHSVGKYSEEKKNSRIWKTRVEINAIFSREYSRHRREYSY